MIAVIGDKTSILPFKALGISTFEAGDPAQAQEILDSIREYKVVFVTEELMKTEPPSNVTLIPGRKGSLGYGKLILKNIIKRATGTEVSDSK